MSQIGSILQMLCTLCNLMQSLSTEQATEQSAEQLAEQAIEHQRHQESIRMMQFYQDIWEQEQQRHRREALTRATYVQQFIQVSSLLQSIREQEQEQQDQELLVI